MKMEAICTEYCCQPDNTELEIENQKTICFKMKSVSLVVPYLEDAAWTVIAEHNEEAPRCLGGCPPPTDELSMAKHLVGEDNFVQYEIIDDIQEDQFEIVCEDYCHEVDAISEGVHRGRRD